MSFKILEVRRTQTPYTLITSGRTVQVLGGIEEATFECGCGHVWTAVSSPTRKNGEFFFQSSSGISAECPSCKTPGQMATEEYDYVL